MSDGHDRRVICEQCDETVTTVAGGLLRGIATGRVDDLAVERLLARDVDASWERHRKSCRIGFSMTLSPRPREWYVDDGPRDTGASIAALVVAAGVPSLTPLQPKPPPEPLSVEQVARVLDGSGELDVDE